MEPRHTPSISVAEVSGHLGVAGDTVYRWIDSRTTPAHRVARVWKFRLAEVDARVMHIQADVLNGTGPKPVQNDNLIVDSTKQVS